MVVFHKVLQNSTAFKRAQNWVSVSDGSQTVGGSVTQGASVITVWDATLQVAAAETTKFAVVEWPERHYQAPQASSESPSLTPLQHLQRYFHPLGILSPSDSPFLPATPLIKRRRLKTCWWYKLTARLGTAFASLFTFNQR